MGKFGTWFNRVKFESKKAREIRLEKEGREQSERARQCLAEVLPVLEKHNCVLAGRVTIGNDGAVDVTTYVEALPVHTRVNVSYKLKGGRE